jgi:Domain of Unknown Function (DUF1206)
VSSALADRHPLTWLAKSGYAARGIVYVIIGWLALVAAVGPGGQTTDSKGALQSLLGQPFGQVLLGIIAVGLLGYVAWRVTQALKDTDDHGKDAKGLVVRGALMISAVTHAALAFFALSLIFGWGGSGGDSGSSDWTAWLMQQMFGQWLVALVGLAVIGAGVAHMWKGWHAKFEKHLDWDGDEKRIGTPICRFGLIARGVAFLIVGGFLVIAAWRANPDHAKGLSGALSSLQDQPYGWILLGVMAIGLIAFGLYSLIEAVYRRVEPAG